MDNFWIGYVLGAAVFFISDVIAGELRRGNNQD